MIFKTTFRPLQIVLVVLLPALSWTLGYFMAPTTKQNETPNACIFPPELVNYQANLNEQRLLANECKHLYEELGENYDVLRRDLIHCEEARHADIISHSKTSE